MSGPTQNADGLSPAALARVEAGRIAMEQMQQVSEERRVALQEANQIIKLHELEIQSLRERATKAEQERDVAVQRAEVFMAETVAIRTKMASAHKITAPDDEEVATIATDEPAKAPTSADQAGIFAVQNAVQNGGQRWATEGTAPDGWVAGHATICVGESTGRLPIEAWRRGHFAIHAADDGFHFGARDEAVAVAAKIESLTDWGAITKQPSDTDLYKSVRKIVDDVIGEKK